MTAETTADTTATLPAVPLRRRGAALEGAILEAAFDELSESGYAAFTVEAVAARARTGKASIYRRWPTRSELLLDAMCAHLPMPDQCGIPVELPDDISTADAFRQIGEAIVEILDSPSGNVMRTIKCEAWADPELARAIDDRFQAPRRDALIALLRRGIARGEVRPGADTAVVADVLPAVLLHRFLMLRDPVSLAAVTEVIDQVMLPLVEPRSGA